MQISRLDKFSVKAVAPTRIDLAGGTIDLWPIHHLLKEKATVNAGISLDAQTTCSLSDQFIIKSVDLGITHQGTFQEITADPKIPLIGLLLEHFWNPQLPPIAIETSAQSPAGAGIGGSSCLGITIAAALDTMRALLKNETVLNSEDLVKTVQDAESNLIKAPTGIQDYWGAIRGNLNIIEFPFGKPVVQTISDSILEKLNTRLILVYSGQSRASAINNWEIFKRIFDGDKTMNERFHKIGSLAYQCAKAMRKGDLEEGFHYSREEWELRKTIWPAIETPMTQKIDSVSKEYGAYFSRVCGAGGGGIMAVFAPDEKRQNIIRNIANCGAKVLQARVANYGLTVTQEA